MHSVVSSIATSPGLRERRRFGHPLPWGEGPGVREYPQRSDDHANLLMSPCIGGYEAPGRVTLRKVFVWDESSVAAEGLGFDRLLGLNRSPSKVEVWRV